MEEVPIEYISNLKTEIPNRLRGLYIDTKNYAISKAYFRIYGVVNINATYTLIIKKIYLVSKNRKFKVSKGNNHEDIKILGRNHKI